MTFRLRWRRWSLGLLTSVILLGGAIAVDRILVPQAYVAGIKVTERSKLEVERAVRDLVARPVVLRWGDHEMQVTADAIGIRLDVDGAIEGALQAAEASLWTRLRAWAGGRLSDVHTSPITAVDLPTLLQGVRTHFPDIEIPPTNIRVRYGEPVGEVVGGTLGRAIDGESLSQQIASALVSPEGRTVEVPTVPVAPPITEATVLGWERLFVLGSSTTTFDPEQAARAGNLRLAAERIDGVLLLPGEEFSLNSATGERTAEAGYREAPVIIDGELVPGIGGGVSQLASTTFNAALLAGLQVTEYHSHSQPVPYLPIGRDATVWFGQLDLRFINTYTHPLVVNAIAGDDWVSVMIRAPEPPELQVSIKTEVIEEYPAPVEHVEDSTLLPGERRLEEEGREGHRVRIEQLIHRDGELIAQRTLEANYRPQAEVWRVGPE